MSNLDPIPGAGRRSAVVCAAFFMTVLDVSIVNVALPSIQRDLTSRRRTCSGSSPPTRSPSAASCCSAAARPTCSAAGASSWPASCSSRSPRSSAACAERRHPDRRARGAGLRRRDHHALGALDRHDDLPEGAERNKALGIWGAVGGARRRGRRARSAASSPSTSAGSGSSSSTSRSASLAFALAPRLVRESRVDGRRRAVRRRRRRDRHRPASRCSSTRSRGARPRLGLAPDDRRLAARVALLIGFVADRGAGAAPLMPLAIFRLRTLDRREHRRPAARRDALRDLLLLTLYVQQVLGYSALKTGSRSSPRPARPSSSAGIAQALVTRRRRRSRS